ncbi:MAG TPA: prolipoprotein diacylglyceryl transferase family protein [Planctomycetota bacterium]|nr:prolipoprotein diacylglyceryl transferase family protein [Planctomycetota bacterium]
MNFPVTLQVGPVAISAHFFLEALAYAAGFLLMRRERRLRKDSLSDDARWTLVVAAIFGAVVGSKLVHWTNDIPELAAHAHDALYWLGGKSIVGGLLGGTLAVELAKSRLGISRRTGDVYVLPLLVSIAIGRIGCFLAGLEDNTYGVATSLPWGVDFGDGVLRHPTQLYEIAALAPIGFILLRQRSRLAEGVLFERFLLAYLAWRVGLDFLKPYPHWLGLSATQLWSLAGIAAEVWFVRARSRRLQGALS